MKVCGITRLEDAQAAAAFGAFAVGFVFWPPSPRFVHPETAAWIIRKLPATIASVGVFVDQAPQEIRRVVEITDIQHVQLHGDEPVDIVREIGRPVIKAIAVRDGFDPTGLDALPPEVLVLLDTHDPVRRGGTGRTVDWSLAARAACRRPVVLSGGLNPSNVREAIERVRPHAIDLASGVEAAPGVKDHSKLRQLFDAVRP